MISSATILTRSGQLAVSCPACCSGRVVCVLTRPYQEFAWKLMKCAECGQHFTYPFPTIDDVRGFYSGDYHAHLTQDGETERTFGSKYQRYVEWIAGFVAVGSLCLDVGCATGYFLKLLQQAGYESIGVDLNPLTAKWGRENYNVRIIESTLEELPIANGPFDLICFTDVLEHTVKPTWTLNAAARRLVRGGHLLVTFPDIGSLESRYYRFLSRVLRREWLWCTCHIPLHVWEFTRQTAIALFRSAGFKVVGFRRSYTNIELSGKLRLLSFPPKLQKVFPMRLGTQMEFMLRKD